MISNAWAQAAQPAAGGGLLSLLPIIIMFGILWFLMIRPQMKKAKEHQKMVSALQKGDEVMTQGGISGKIDDIEESFVHLKIASLKSDEAVLVTVQRNAVVNVLPKGTLKNI